MQVFDRATNFKVEGCVFFDNSTGRRETLAAVLDKLRNEAALRASYDTIHRTENPSATLTPGIISDITSTQNSKTHFVYFIHSISPSDTREYGEAIARHCVQQQNLVATVFFQRLLVVFPAEGKQRLVATLAYQLAVSPRAPEGLKIEILGALHLEPDLPERNLAEQFDKLIVRPLQHVKTLLNPGSPVVLVLDSVHNMTYDTVADIIKELLQAVTRLNQTGVNARAVITGVEYDPIVKTFQGIKNGARLCAIPATNPTSLSSLARFVSFPFLDLKYRLPEFFQRGVEILSLTSGLIIFSLTMLNAAIRFLPPTLLYRLFQLGPLFFATTMIVVPFYIACLIYRELARLAWPRSI